MTQGKYWTRKQALPIPAFSRASIAYQDGKEVPANTLRPKVFALPSTSDGAIPAAAGESGEHVAVHCKNASYLFGIGITSSRVYRSTDGVTWARTAYTTTMAGVLFCTTAGTLLAFKSDRTVWYSADNGATFTQGAYDTARTNTSTTRTSVITNWSMRQNGNTLMLTEYGTEEVLSGRQVYRSVDEGHTWTKVADLSSFPQALTTIVSVVASTKVIKIAGNQTLNIIAGAAFVVSGTAQNDGVKTVSTVTFNTPNTDIVVTETCYDAAAVGLASVYGIHIHTCVYHAATGRWLVLHGDTMAKRGILFSTDDGLTWGRLNYPGNLMDQHVAALDVGDPTRVLAGSDGASTIAWVNALTGEMERIDVLTDQRASKAYVFAVGQYAGVYYAGGFENFAAFNKAACTISNNGSGKIRITKTAGDFLNAYDGQVVDCQFSATYANGGYAILAHDGTDHAYIDIDLAYSSAVPTVTAVGYLSAPVIWVSTDRVNWSVYHKFLVTDQVKGIHEIIGYFGGKMHFLVQSTYTGSYRTFSISPANVRTVGGTLIEPAVTNLANTVNLSSFETSSTWAAMALRMTVEKYASAYVGSYGLKITGEDNNVAAVSLRSGAMTLGNAGAEKKYVIQCRMKATRPIYGTIQLYRNFGSTGWIEAANDAAFVIDKDWKHIRSHALTLAAGDTGDFRIYLNFTQGSLAAEIFMDAFQITELPISEWQVGGTAKAADVLTETVAAPSAWTDIFAVQTNGMDIHYAAAANLYIKTWKVGDDELCLYYNVTDSKFYIQRNAETAVASAAQKWHPNQVIKFALRADADGLTLYIQNGRAAEHIHDSALAALLDAEVTMIYGDVNSANQFPGIYADGMLDESISGIDKGLLGFIPFALSTAEVAAAFNLAPTVFAQ